MSNADEEPYSTIFASLKHPIRRKILRMLSKEPMNFSEMLEVLGVSSSFLVYHLENLGELVSKTDDGKYRLSSFGEAALSTMTKVEDIPATASHHLGTKSGKTVGRNVAIALGLVCILMVAGFGVTLGYYAMTINNKQGELNSANNTINQLNTRIAGQNDTISQLDSNVTNLQDENNQMQIWLDGNLTLLDQTQTWLSGNATAYYQLQNEVSSIYISDTKNSTVLINNETVYEYPEKLGVNMLVGIPFLNETGMNETTYVIRLPVFSFGPFPSSGYVAVLFSSNSTSNTLSVSYGYLKGFNFNVGSNGIVIFPVSPSSNYSMVYGSQDIPSVFTLTVIYYY